MRSVTARLGGFLGQGTTQMVNHPNRSRRRAGASTLPSADVTASDDHFAALRELVADALNRVPNDAPVFTTSAEGLFETFLDALPGERQVHTCSACRAFFRRYGGLATVNPDGTLKPVIWDSIADVPDFYAHACRRLSRTVRAAEITGLLVSRERVLGTPISRYFPRYEHLWLRHSRAYAGTAEAAERLRVSRREGVKVVTTAVDIYHQVIVDRALRLVETLPIAEKFVGPLRWLSDLLVDLSRLKRDRSTNRNAHNLIWRTVARAPEGYLHWGASALGELLEDLRLRRSDATALKNFRSRTDSLVYQRPIALPTAGNVDRAEALVEKLGIRRSLERRYAVLEDCLVAWRPSFTERRAPRAVGGVFAGLARRSIAEPELNVTQTLTWTKFRDTVLPDVIELQVALAAAREPLITLTAPVHADAPPPFKWNSGVAWYVYHRGASPETFNLPRTGGFLPVVAVVPLPTCWHDGDKSHLGDGAVLVIQGCRDRTRGQGLGLFPECLRGELHEVRAAIEAFSKRGDLAGGDDPRQHAAGLDLRAGGTINRTLRVRRGRTDAPWQRVVIDRWD